MQLIKGRMQGALKVVIYGPEGIGKSTFASRFPEPVFIDTEGSTRHMDVLRTEPPRSYAALLEQVKEFIMHPDTLGTLVIDTADWAEKLCIEELLCEKRVDGIESFGYGKGYTYAAEKFGRLLALLDGLIDRGVNVVVTAHAMMRKFEQPDELGAYDRWELKMGKKTAPLLKEWADILLFANYKTVVVNVDNQGAAKGRNKAQGGTRVMYTTHHPCWDAKNRFGLADELPFDYGQIAHLIPRAPTKTDRPAQTAQAPDAPAQAHAAAAQSDEAAQAGEAAPVTAMPAQAAQDTGVPPALAQLMNRDHVTQEELRRAVAAAGYYPEKTQIAAYDMEFVRGVLVADWPGVLRMIERLRAQSEEVPF